MRPAIPENEFRLGWNNLIPHDPMPQNSPDFLVAHEFHANRRVADLVARRAFYTAFLGNVSKGMQR